MSEVGKWVTFILQNINVSTLGVLGLGDFSKRRADALTRQNGKRCGGAVVRCSNSVFEFFIHFYRCQRQQRPQELIENFASINPHNC